MIPYKCKVLHMTTVQITKDGNPILRAVAEPVQISDISSVKVQKIIKSMSAALSTERYGVAIAAPQIGESLRIFVVAGKVFAKRKGTNSEDEPNQIFINPEILRVSKKRQESHESCLSIQGRPAERGPDVAGIVERPEKITISHYDETGKKMERGASGFLAAIFDHEIDHLNGVLFTDKTVDVWEIDSDFNRV